MDHVVQEGLGQQGVEISDAEKQREIEEVDGRLLALGMTGAEVLALKPVLARRFRVRQEEVAAAEELFRLKELAHAVQVARGFTVYVRFRRLLVDVEREIMEEQGFYSFDKVDEYTLELLDARSGKVKDYVVDKTFDAMSTGPDVFGEVQGLVRDMSATKPLYLFFYGATGSGKTTTMKDVLMGVAGKLAVSTSKTVEVVEVYQNRPYDLLHRGLPAQVHAHPKLKTAPLALSGFGVTSTALLWTSANSLVAFVADVLARKRVTRKHGANSESSRSHVLVTIHVDGKKLVLVDLAGKEPASVLQGLEVDKDEVDVLKEENKSINLSLTAVSTLLRGGGVTPPHLCRNCTLTRLMKPVLERSCTSAMFITVSPVKGLEAQTKDSLDMVDAVRATSADLRGCCVPGAQ